MWIQLEYSFVLLYIINTGIYIYQVFFMNFCSNRRSALLALGAFATPFSMAQDAQGMADKMMAVLGSAKESTEVLRAWSAYRAGSKAAVGEIFSLAQQGNATAQNFAGWMLDNGKGVKKDSAAAFNYFVASEKSYPLAKYNVGVLYFFGRGVTKNEDRAYGLFKEAATGAGVQQAQVRLALHALAKGNRDEAWKWASEASNRGNVIGFYLLGRMLFEKKSYKESYAWLMKAAQASEPNSPALLSKIYEQGLGADKNPVMGAAWWMIYIGKNKDKEGAGTVAAFNLEAAENREAAAFANKWLAAHGESQKVDYKGTIYEVFG
jgi:TPR repeat protein